MMPAEQPTAIGKMYARLIKNGVRNYPDDVPERYRAETVYAWSVMYPNEPPLEEQTE